ncbi:hypothetical protein ONZ45_g14510 [Pleurotus djamor]|nr:hypothetical protein ONZ45_g14510 [Pleurotus djamor]
MWTPLFLPLVLAALALAGPDRQHCGDVSDLSDVALDPACKVSYNTTTFSAPSFSISKWIWTGEVLTPGATNPPGIRAFRKTIVPSGCGKCARYASIIIASDDSHKLYVNGVLVGEGGGFKTGQALHVALNKNSNVFAIEGNNTGSAAGVMATIRFHYADGSFEDFITDETWRVTRGTPPQNFQSIGTSDVKWPFATLQGTYDNSHWGKPALPPVLGLEKAAWIWTSDHTATAAPRGERVFRKTLNNCGKTAVAAQVVMAADNAYTLFLNGEQVSKGSSYKVANGFTIPKLHPTYNSLAVRAYNNGGPAGVIATFRILYSDGTTEDVVTDATWKASIPIPKGFEQPFTDDSEWEDAKVIATDGVGIWKKLRLPLA